RRSPDPIRGSDNDRGGVEGDRGSAEGQSAAEVPSRIPSPGWHPPLREMREADALRRGAARRQAGRDTEGVPMVPVPPVQASNPARRDPPVGGSSVPGRGRRPGADRRENPARQSHQRPSGGGSERV